MIRSAQCTWSKDSDWHSLETLGVMDSPQTLVLLFGVTDSPEYTDAVHRLLAFFPNSHVAGCSSSGEINNSVISVSEAQIVATIYQFDHTQIRIEHIDIEPERSFEAGKVLGKSLYQDSLTWVFVLSDGLMVNGSELASGFNSILPASIPVTGGLAGDHGRFEKTLVWYQNHAKSGRIVAIGFYGHRLHVGFGSGGGWREFGPDRTVTHSESNVVYEIDYEPALSLYRTYLGEQANELPGSGLRYPLNLYVEEAGTSVIRTLLAIDEEEESVTFAGDVPEGAKVQLMSADIPSLVKGAEDAAKNCEGKSSPDAAILISCVGRRLLFNQMADDEVDAVREVLGKDALLCGFYSYGELAPYGQAFNCGLHNQTMTITTLKED
ncbi:FIST C-terminal domain-containing protein [Enterovibrio sp. ZSDZ35]|uniref:FIST C-terminal domain-containing protein n=1 Tax=Enterovibrio qingdaonensis TaxID=2899818 RepID=A0ABT5QSG4_9GAMM|nr:FIST N-terminal domain-containing protein [Enterovibrio sp. ZSDZ35]MDD1783844.1 FIST C-terminal domain-containing protein [Enterovibrio sp. ZSDZ35]